MLLEINKQRTVEDKINLFAVQTPTGYAYFCDYPEDVYVADTESPYTVRLYLSIAISFTGVEYRSEGAFARPRVQVANVFSVFKDAIGCEPDDLLGYRITRRQVLESALLTSGDYPGTDSKPFEYPRQVYVFEKVEGRNAGTISFELTAPFDLSGIEVPYRKIASNACSWPYQGEATGKGACYWTNNNNGFTVLLNKNDELLFTGNATSHSGGSYTKDLIYSVSNTTDFYEVNGSTTSRSAPYYWQPFASGSGTLSTENSRRCFLYANYSPTGTYRRAVTSVFSDLVIYSGKVYKCIQSHAGGKQPNTSPTYWERVDLCSKKLSSCSARFASVEASNGLASAVGRDRSKDLPYGGFPASRRFS